MKVLEKISDYAGKYMAIIALLVAIIALVFPGPVSSVIKTSYFILVTVFQLPPELAVGVILVGCCPGGTSSNVMTYLAKGDVALSVGMTACTTIMAPIVTPLLVLLIAGQTVDVAVWDMFISIVQVVLVPIAAGFIINKLFEKFAKEFSRVLPLISVIGISLIIMAVVAANAQSLMSVGLLIIVVVMLHNVCGYALGYLAGRLLGLSKAQRRTLSIEVGMQNSGLATSLATVHFATMPLAAVPGAVFSVWHNISGAIYANILARSAGDDSVAKADLENRIESGEIEKEEAKEQSKAQ